MAAKFPVVTGLAVDRQGNVFASQANRVRRIDTNGVVSTIAGATNTNVTYLDGAGASARFGRLQGILIAVTTSMWQTPGTAQHDESRRISTQGVVTTVVGQLPGTVTPAASLTLGNLPGVVPYLDEVTVGPLSTLYITVNNHTLTNPATSARVILKAQPR